MGKTMWFLIKGTFWFSMVLVLLPFIDGESTKKLENAPAVELGDTFTAASEAITYLSAMCLEKPDVCEKGAETFVALGHRAKEGARVAYKMLDAQFAETDVATAEPARIEDVLDQPLPDAKQAKAAIAADDVITGTIAIPTRRPDRTE